MWETPCVDRASSAYRCPHVKRPISAVASRSCSTLVAIEGSGVSGNRLLKMAFFEFHTAGWARPHLTKSWMGYLLSTIQAGPH